MGNRALRKEAAAAIKALGLPTKLYRGRAARYQPAILYRDILFYLSFKVGDVVGECDGSNHRIKSLLFNQTPSSGGKSYNRQHKGYFLNAYQFAYEDGHNTCCLDEKKSREEYEKKWTDWTSEDIQDIDENSRDFHIYCWLKAGGHIYDEDGIIYPQWKYKRNLK